MFHGHGQSCRMMISHIDCELCPGLQAIKVRRSLWFRLARTCSVHIGRGRDMLGPRSKQCLWQLRPPMRHTPASLGLPTALSMAVLTGVRCLAVKLFHQPGVCRCHHRTFVLYAPHVCDTCTAFITYVYLRFCWYASRLDRELQPSKYDILIHVKHTDLLP